MTHIRRESVPEVPCAASTPFLEPTPTNPPVSASTATSTVAREARQDLIVAWIAGFTAFTASIGLVLTNWLAFRKEKREMVRAEVDLRKVRLENEKLRAELDQKKEPPERRRVKRPLP